MVSAAILVLTSAILIFGAFRSMGTCRASLEVQRDAAAAMKALEFSLRGASRYEIIAATGRITVATSGKAFYRSGNRLVYDPDISAGGDETALVDSGVLAFSPSVTQRQVNVVLLLSNRWETLAITSSVALRNTP